MTPKVKKPKLSDGAPKGYSGNHHLWYLKQYRKWLSQKNEMNETLKSNAMNVYCFKHEKVIEAPADCKDYFFVGAPYHGMGMHNSCLTCKYKFFFNSAEELSVEINKRKS